MNHRLRRYVRVAFSLGLGLLLLWLITRGQDIEQIMSEFRSADYRLIFLAMLCAFCSHFLRAVRWNMLIRTMGYRTSSRQTFYAVMTGYLANLAIPRMGEITRCVTLSKSTATPFNALAGTVVAERVFDVFSLFAIVFITIISQFGFLKNFLDKLFWQPMVSRGLENWIPLLAIGLGMLAIGLAILFFVRNKLRNPLENSFFHKIKRQLRGFIDGVKTIRHLRGKAWFVLYTFLIWGLYFMTVYLCFFALQATSHLGLFAGLTLLAVGSLGILAPVPGGIGTYHFLTIITLTELYSIASEPATSYAYITHATQIIVNIIGGTASWIILSLQNKSRLRS